MSYSNSSTEDNRNFSKDNNQLCTSHADVHKEASDGQEECMSPEAVRRERQRLILKATPYTSQIKKPKELTEDQFASRTDSTFYICLFSFLFCFCFKGFFSVSLLTLFVALLFFGDINT